MLTSELDPLSRPWKGRWCRRHRWYEPLTLLILPTSMVTGASRAGVEDGAYEQQGQDDRSATDEDDPQNEIGIQLSYSLPSS
jgi:hypothetical protein